MPRLITRAEKAAYNSRNGVLTEKQKKFIIHYVRHKNGTRAAIDAGVPEKSAASMACQWLDPTLFPLVAQAVQRELDTLNERCIMDAEAVRRYVHTVLQFCPADYFTPGNRGGWLISQDDYRCLPSHIKQMVEEMTAVNTRVEAEDGSVVEKYMLSVKFISKTAAMALAAKYGLTEAHSINVQTVQVPWDELYQRTPITDVIEQKIEEVENGEQKKIENKELDDGDTRSE